MMRAARSPGEGAPGERSELVEYKDNEIGGYEGMGKFVKTEFFKKLNVGFAIDESGPGERESFLVFNDERPHWDNEIGGYEGMGKFVKTEFFKKLNVGFAIDESGPGERESFLVFNDERPHWELKKDISCLSVSEASNIIIQEMFHKQETAEGEEEPSVALFREYLRIKTVHPNPDYKSAVKFLKKQAKRIGIHFEMHGSDAKPIVMYTWKGHHPTQPSILLNSHIDVVPANEENWTFKPFEAVKEDGRIYGRGSQDTKNTTIQYIEAANRLKKEGFKPNRTIHMTFVPDNEIGGYEGMGKFVKTEFFKKLNVGFAIDESGPGERESFLVFNDERPHWVVEFKCRGEPGHGCFLQSNTAPEKAQIILNELYTRRTNEAKSLVGKPMPEVHQGTMTSINLTKIKGGTDDSTIPDEIAMTFDLMVSVNDDDDVMMAWLKEVATKAGSGVSYNFKLKEAKPAPTVLDEHNSYWVTMQKAMIKRGFTFATIPSPASTDARFLRAIGIPTVGFSGMRHTPVLAHSNNEYIDESVFMEGINVFYEIIKALASMHANPNVTP